jgi:hypothetical protein
MPSAILYSTNVFLKLFIQQEYRHDIHYVWCSELFDSAKAPFYSRGSLIPPTSNPLDIYRDLQEAVRRQDRHNSCSRGSGACSIIFWIYRPVIATLV